MSLTVVVGGQYGSEGKGKLVSYLACMTEGEVAVVRCGGTNAGHTAEGNGKRWMLRQLPSGAVREDCELYLAAGMVIDVDLLLEEIARTGISPARLHIDTHATLIDETDAGTERTGDLRARVGSTLSGTGAAAARKLMREPNVVAAVADDALYAYRDDAVQSLHALLQRGAHIIVEGTQGAGLSLHHGNFPFVTGRDTTAAAFLSEAGLPVTAVSDVVMVLRTYPIRVAGNSGPMPAGEISWETVAERAGCPTALAEYTSVTGKLRRVGEFDFDLARRAVALNGPTSLAVHGVDYLAHTDLGCRSFEALSDTSRMWLTELELELHVPVRYVFTGPDGAELIDRGTEYRLAAPGRAVETRGLGT